MGVNSGSCIGADADQLALPPVMYSVSGEVWFGPQLGFTMGSTYLGGAPWKHDDRLIRHEAKHANQWAWFGGGAIFPLVYAVSPRTWESQAGLSDGCYQKRDGC